MPRTRITPLTRARAIKLRNEATFPEQKLWYALRELRSLGLHFRRQAPVGKYIVDFACHAQKLIIEVDGHTHSTARELAHDARRTKFLESQGYTVLRCNNDDALKNDEGVIMEILRTTGKDK